MEHRLLPTTSVMNQSMDDSIPSLDVNESGTFVSDYNDHQDSTSFDRQLADVTDPLCQLISSERKWIENEKLKLERSKVMFQQEMDVKRNELRKVRTLWEASSKKAASMYVEEGEIITLDIGGEGSITTSMKILQKYPDSALAAMFSGKYTIVQHKGKAFIDRDYRPFELVISFLRSGKIPNFTNDREELDFKDELDYWQIPLEVILPVNISSVPRFFLPKICTLGLTLESDNTQAIKHGHDQSIIISNIPLDSDNNYMEFKVTLDNCDSKLSLGLMDKSNYKPSLFSSFFAKETPFRYYWDVLNSNLVKVNEEERREMASDYGCGCEMDETLYGVEYDSEQKTVAFYKNGINQGVAFTAVPEGLFPALDLRFQAGKVTYMQSIRPSLHLHE